MSSSGPVLPNEICFSIIDHAVEDKETSKATLKASSLVNRDFASFCQRHIFRQITVGVCGPLTSKRKALVQILAQSPHIARCVKDVSYVFGTEGFTEPFGGLECANDKYSLTLGEFLPSIHSVTIRHRMSRCSTSYSRPPSCPGCLLGSDALEELKSSHGSSITMLVIQNHKCTSLATILDFPQLAHLTLFNCALVKTWPKTDSHQQVAAPTRIRKLSIKRLALDIVQNFPIELLDYLGELEYLRVGGNIMGESNKQGTHQHLQTMFWTTTPYARLREVDIHDIDLFADICRKAAKLHSMMAPFPSLRSLKVVPNRSGRRHTLVMWDWTRNFFGFETRLEEIILLEGSLGDVREIPNFVQFFQNCNQTLRSIKVQDVMLIGDTVEDDNFVQAIHNGLASVQGRNIIEVLDLSIHIENGARLLDTRQIVFFHDWQRLDAVLMEDRNTNFPHLRSVRISLNLQLDWKAGGGKNGRDAALRNIMREPLQRLYSTSELDFQCHLGYRLLM